MYVLYVCMYQVRSSNVGANTLHNLQRHSLLIHLLTSLLKALIVFRVSFV